MSALAGDLPTGASGNTPESTAARQSVAQRRLRLGMVGGGQGAFIGGVHRIAARLDDQWTLVAGALSSDAQRACASAAELGLDAARSYSDYRVMAQSEATRPDGIDAVAIVTPNHLHAPIAHAFMDAGIDVICDKPLALTLDEGRALAARARAQGRVFIVTYTYSGYPMVRHARQLVKDGVLGPLRRVQVEYPQDWLARPVEQQGIAATAGTAEASGVSDAEGAAAGKVNKQAQWRTDPARSGEAGCLGDIGTHGFHLARFVTGLRVTSLSASLGTLVVGRQVDDDVDVLLRFEGGARGHLWASQVATGAVNGLRLRVFGDRGSIDFQQEQPDELRLLDAEGHEHRLRRGRSELPRTALQRVPAGHPEGYLEAFASLYRDAAAHVRARIEGTAVPAYAADLSLVDDGVEGLAFVDAALRSHRTQGAWTALAS